MGILGTLLGRREPVVEYRTVDGGHPAPFPDMTDEQLYNYEVTFNVPNRTFKEPPRSVRPPENRPSRKEPPLRKEPMTETAATKTRERPPQPSFDIPQHTTRTAQRPTESMPAAERAELPPLDLSKPVRLVTTKQPVEIITTRARHPVYKVHGYIGDDDVVTVFTLEGQLSENGPRYLENIPQKQQLYLNIYPNPDVHAAEKYLLTQHASKEQADAAAKPGRIACMPLQFDL